jgi:MFS family permease
VTAEPETTEDSARPDPARRRWWQALVMDTRPLRIASYRRLWVSNVATSVGAQLTIVAVPKQVYDLTGSSGYVGLAGAVALVPLLVFGLWGGAIADVMDRRILLLISSGGIAVTSVLFWVQAAAGLDSVWLVLVLLGLQQVFFAVNQPTRSAAIARLVPAELLPSAGALSGTVTSFGAVLGPMLAGALIPVLGLSTLYLIDACGMTLTLWAVWRLPPLPPPDGSAQRAGLAEVIDGFRYLGARKVLLASFLADLIAMVFGLPRALFPEMAEHTFGDPPGGGLALGLLFAAMPVGSLLAGLLSGWLSRVRRQGVAIAVGVAAWGLAVAGFGLSGQLWLAVLFMALGGAADMISMVFRGSMLQVAASDEMRGRMQGVFIVVVAGGPRLGDVLHGTVGAAVGASVAVTGGGLLVVVLVAVAATLLPAFWRYRSPASSVPSPG